jgi:glucose/arabinose dehydrogenase
MASSAHAQTQIPDQFEDQLVIGGLDGSIGMAFLPDGRLLVAERPGRCRLLVEGKFGALDPILMVDSLGIASEEEGLLGIAVDPQWPARPYVYTYSTAVDSTIRISRFRASGNLTSGSSVDLAIDQASRFEILSDIPNRNKINNGGTIRFGPDGLLYAALGDDYYRCGAQDTSTLRGVLLRLKVDQLPDGPGAVSDKNVLVAPGNPYSTHPLVNARLVWALGLRNPFRFHVDRVGGNAFLADRGSFQYEEISIADTPGLDLGWPYFEGEAPA